MTKSKTDKKWSFAPGTFVLIIALSVIVGYVGGTKNDQIVGAVAPVLGFKVVTNKLDLASVQTTYQQLKANFDGTLDDKALIEGASKGLVAASGDIHTEYFTSAEAKEFDNQLNGTIGGGIGAEIGIRDNNPTVIRVLKDTPAEKAGLQTSDILVSINDETVAKLTVDEVVKKIRGDIGSTVKIIVARDGQAKTFSITRAEVTSPSVESKINGDVGILTVSRFDGNTGAQARAAAQDLLSKGAKKIILDLRDNGGGSLDAAPKVAGLWLDNKVVVTERRNGKQVGEQRSESGGVLFEGLPTVVLVNAGTASASEIVTMALKDYGVATIVGEKTYGKGTVQTLISGLNGGAELKVTIQRWYSPKGTNVDGKGITPAQVVGLTKTDAEADRDPQLEAALNRLNK